MGQPHRRVKFLTLTAVLALTGCATVDMVPNSAPVQVSNPLEVQSRTTLKTSARKLTSVFATEGWAFIGGEGQQSAMSMLIWGKTKAKALSDPIADYLERRSDRKDVLTDMSRARTIVEETTLRAEAFLAENPAVSNVRKELSALEKALLSARQAETTFLKAMDKTGIAPGHKDYVAYVHAVNRMRAAADRFGDRVRRSNMPAAQS